MSFRRRYSRWGGTTTLNSFLTAKSFGDLVFVDELFIGRHFGDVQHTTKLNPQRSRADIIQELEQLFRAVAITPFNAFRSSKSSDYSAPTGNKCAEQLAI